MRIGKRLFPYPILNRDSLYSQFNENVFILHYDEVLSDDKQNYILENVYCELTDSNLIKLIKEDKARILLILECPSTIIRRKFQIGLSPMNINIPMSDLNGKFNISAFVVATTDIIGYRSDNFIADYADYTFDIEKHDILAADDGYINRVDYDENEDNMNSSIFLIYKDKSIADSTMRIDYDMDKIKITLPEKEWNYYERTKRIPQLKDIYFSMFAIPALDHVISKLQHDDPSVDGLRMDYSWFGSFCEAYNRVHGEELTDEVFMRMDANVEAQKMLKAPVISSIDTIFNTTVTKRDDDYGD
jgi:hypothetical protein